MRKAIAPLLVVFCGVVGAYAGYWIGYLAGWSPGAEWPWSFRSGTGAILLAIATAILSMVAASWWLGRRTLRRNRKLLRRGTRARARIVRVWRTGTSFRPRHPTRTQLAMELEVRSPDGTSRRVRTTSLATLAEEAQLGAGTEVVIRYDPARPARAAVEGPLETFIDLDEWI